jgi:CheY-like chemotaxis protein
VVGSVGQPISSPPLRVLFVDDEGDVREIARIQLRAAGFEVATAASGVEALALFDARRFDVVVTDLFMPEGDGIELIQDLRAREPRLPIVVISGGSERHQTALGVAMMLGADVALQKPYGADELVLAIDRAVEAAG